jgi:hypothetical protein
MRRFDVKLSSLLAPAALVVSGIALIATPVLAEVTPIVILSAVFGPAKATRPIDFTAKLAQTCGASANYCQAFCTRAAVNYQPPHLRPLFVPPRSVCRVAYRCGVLQTRVTEADENDTFTLSCRPRT